MPQLKSSLLLHWVSEALPPHSPLLLPQVLQPCPTTLLAPQPHFPTLLLDYLKLIACSSLTARCSLGLELSSLPPSPADFCSPSGWTHRRAMQSTPRLGKLPLLTALTAHGLPCIYSACSYLPVSCYASHTQVGACLIPCSIAQGLWGQFLNW